jgi:hypothetical protein
MKLITDDSKVTVSLITHSMDINDYVKLWETMSTWLDDNNISYDSSCEHWHTLPTHVHINAGDAIVFKLRFGL